MRFLYYQKNHMNYSSNALNESCYLLPPQNILLGASVLNIRQRTPELRTSRWRFAWHQYSLFARMKMHLFPN